MASQKFRTLNAVYLLNKNLLITGNYSFYTEIGLELGELFTKLGFHCGCLWEE